MHYLFSLCQQKCIISHILASHYSHLYILFCCIIIDKKIPNFIMLCWEWVHCILTCWTSANWIFVKKIQKLRTIKTWLMFKLMLADKIVLCFKLFNIWYSSHSPFQIFTFLFVWQNTLLGPYLKVTRIDFR